MMIQVIYKQIENPDKEALARAYELLFEKTLQNYKKQETSAGGNLVGAEAPDNQINNTMKTI